MKQHKSMNDIRCMVLVYKFINLPMFYNHDIPKKTQVHYKWNPWRRQTQGTRPKTGQKHQVYLLAHLWIYNTVSIQKCYMYVPEVEANGKRVYESKKRLSE